jgi:hypothetical protein
MLAQLRQGIRFKPDCADVCAATATLSNRRTGANAEVIRKPFGGGRSLVERGSRRRRRAPVYNWRLRPAPAAWHGATSRGEVPKWS